MRRRQEEKSDVVYFYQTLCAVLETPVLMKSEVDNSKGR